jgi:hypothetical protein
MLITIGVYAMIWGWKFASSPRDESVRATDAGDVCVT